MGHEAYQDAKYFRGVKRDKPSLPPADDGGWARAKRQHDRVKKIDAIQQAAWERQLYPAKEKYYDAESW